MAGAVGLHGFLSPWSSLSHLGRTDHSHLGRRGPEPKLWFSGLPLTCFSERTPFSALPGSVSSAVNGLTLRLPWVLHGLLGRQARDDTWHEMLCELHGSEPGGFDIPSTLGRDMNSRQCEMMSSRTLGSEGA